MGEPIKLFGIGTGSFERVWCHGKQRTQIFTGTVKGVGDVSLFRLGKSRGQIAAPFVLVWIVVNGGFQLIKMALARRADHKYAARLQHTLELILENGSEQAYDRIGTAVLKRKRRGTRNAEEGVRAR